MDQFFIQKIKDKINANNKSTYKIIKTAGMSFAGIVALIFGTSVAYADSNETKTIKGIILY